MKYCGPYLKGCCLYTLTILILLIFWTILGYKTVGLNYGQTHLPNAISGAYKQVWKNSRRIFTRCNFTRNVCKSLFMFLSAHKKLH